MVINDKSWLMWYDYYILTDVIDYCCTDLDPVLFVYVELSGSGMLHTPSSRHVVVSRIKEVVKRETGIPIVSISTRYEISTPSA